MPMAAGDHASPVTARRRIYRRLANHCIAGTQLATPEAVVRWVGALQAQDYRQSLWAIGVRLRSGTLVDVEQAIADGKIVRTWPMRGTLHWAPAEDAKWMLQLGAARMLAQDRRRQAALELDAAILARCHALFHAALEGGKRLSRPAMLQLLEDAGISTKSQRGYHILWHAAQSGLICLGPVQDKQQTFVLLDEWAPQPRRLGREEVLAELARRYFASHGPATIHDFAWWAGLTVTETRSALEAIKPELAGEKVDGKEYWFAGDSFDLPAVDPSGAHLLAAFDEYLLGYTDRSLVLAAEYAPKIIPGNNGVFQPTLVVCGQVAGTWKLQRRTKAIDITIHPFTPLGDMEGPAIEAARRYCAFAGLPLGSADVGTDP